jgi:glycine C-acetyltransferase
MLDMDVYVIGFFYPVVPMGQARVRVQLSALHTPQDLDYAMECFSRVKAQLGI